VTLGFEFCETLRGTYHRLSDPAEEFPVTLTARAAVPDVARLALDPRLDLSGEIDAQGFADRKPLDGTVHLRPLLGRKLTYEIRFPNNEDVLCRFRGEQDIDVKRLLSTLAILPGSILIDDREVARVILRLSPRHALRSFARSFKRT
jgi:hypothetical protein